MRFILFDKIVDFKKNVSGVGIKNVTVGEDFFIEHYTRRPIMPEPLVVEAVAQIGGWVISVSGDFKYAAILAKIGNAKFYKSIRPGDQLRIDVEILSLNDYGASIRGVAKVEGTVVAEVDNLTYILHELSEEMKKDTINTNIYNSGGFLDNNGVCKKESLN